MTKVYHQEIFGLREEKYDWLKSHSISNVEWNEIEPEGDFYIFKPQDKTYLQEYQSFKKITELFLVYSVGIVTARDKLTIGWTEDEIWRRIQNFAKLDPEIARQAYKLGKDTIEWQINFAKNDLIENEFNKNLITKISYRPFDTRYTYYTGKSKGFHCRPRKEIMLNFVEDNLGLISSRQSDSSGALPVFVSNKMTDAHLITSAVSGSYLFPLYLYPDINLNHLFSGEKIVSEKKPNIKREVFEELQANFQKEVSPEEIFYYIYAVLYSNTYREKYKEFLKIDFPRIPFTKDYERFITLGKLGERLANIHLLKSTELDFPIAKYPEAGSNRVEKVVYETGKVWINKQQYFSNVPEEVWQYHIGGYQVCDKWLKDRKGRTLSLDEIKTYCKIVSALSKTIEIQAEIDL